MIKYFLSADFPHRHIWSGQILFDIQNQEDIILYLPTWTPGSYMIRDFSKNLFDLKLLSHGNCSLLRQINKNSWLLSACKGEVRIGWKCYAEDLSVRGSYLDHRRGFFDGPSLLLGVKGRESEEVELHLDVPCDWNVATALKKTGVDEATHLLEEDVRQIASHCQLKELRDSFPRLYNSSSLAAPNDSKSAKGNSDSPLDNKDLNENVYTKNSQYQKDTSGLCIHIPDFNRISELRTHHYSAKDYWELLDCPVEAGHIVSIPLKNKKIPHTFHISGLKDIEVASNQRRDGSFCALGDVSKKSTNNNDVNDFLNKDGDHGKGDSACPEETDALLHPVTISGAYVLDAELLRKDVTAITDCQIDFFGGETSFDNYDFLLHVSNGFYGGLEHRSSTALLESYETLPFKGMTDRSQYTDFLGLVSHEYFHAWNVKAAKPKAFEPYDLDKENYTRLLWAFEGMTEYYAQYFLARSGVITPEEYAKELQDVVDKVVNQPGNEVSPLSESSFEAWTKFYQRTPNTNNVISNYYQKGRLVAMLMDAEITMQSEFHHSLNDVARAIYKRWKDKGEAIGEEEWQEVAKEATGVDLTNFFQKFIYGTEPLPLKRILSSQGLKLTYENKTKGAQRLGLTLKVCPEGQLVTSVSRNSLAHQAGLMAGDTLVAINRATVLDKGGITGISRQLDNLIEGDRVLLHFFRRGFLHESDFLFHDECKATVTVSVTDKDIFRSYVTKR